MAYAGPLGAHRRPSTPTEVGDQLALLVRTWLPAALPADGPADRALGLGTGCSRFAGLLADRYAEVLAVDPAEREVALAQVERRRPNLVYRVGDPFGFGAAGGHDLVLAINTVARASDALAGIRGLVRPGGWIVLVDAVRPRPRDAGPALTRTEYHRRCGATLPGAEITDSVRPPACALRWRRVPPMPAGAASGDGEPAGPAW